MNISTLFSKKLKNTLIKLQLAESYLAAVESFLAKKSRKQLISLVDFSAETGIEREKTVLFFSLLSLPPNPPFKPITIPYALGKSWPSFKLPGIITDKGCFERIPSETDEDGWVPLNDVELILNYEVCSE